MLELMIKRTLENKEIALIEDGKLIEYYIEENKEEEHTGTKKADTDAGKESIKDGFEKGSRVY